MTILYELYFRWLSGKEFFCCFYAAQDTEECLFVINWRNDIDTDMEIEYGGKFMILPELIVFKEITPQNEEFIK